MIETSSNFSAHLDKIEMSVESPLPQNSERFKMFIEHLPEIIKIDIFNSSIEEEVLDEQLIKKIPSFSMLKNKSPYKVSKMAISAYRIGKISFEEMSTIFMHISALEELYLNQKMDMQVYDKK